MAELSKHRAMNFKQLFEEIDRKNFAFQLVSGSSGTEQSDEHSNGASDTDVGKGDGYTEGIPGPVTRLFVLANRGLSNLVQDLILVRQKLIKTHLSF